MSRNIFYFSFISEKENAFSIKLTKQPDTYLLSSKKWRRFFIPNRYDVGRGHHMTHTNRCLTHEGLELSNLGLLVNWGSSFVDYRIGHFFEPALFNPSKLTWQATLLRKTELQDLVTCCSQCNAPKHYFSSDIISYVDQSKLSLWFSLQFLGERDPPLRLLDYLNYVCWKFIDSSSFFKIGPSLIFFIALIHLCGTRFLWQILFTWNLYSHWTRPRAPA